MLIKLLALIVFNALVIIGVHRAADLDGGMILSRLHQMVRSVVGEFFTKPVFGCPTCMASVHSIYVFWPVMLYTFGFGWWEVYLYVLYIPALGGASTYLNERI